MADLTTTDLAPRLESQVLSLKMLTEEQRSACVRVHTLLREYAKITAPRVETPRGMRRFLPAVDGERRNQNVLLDGDRGSGKTALLVTLLDLWNAAFDPEYAARGTPKWGEDRGHKRSAWGIDAAPWPVVPVGLLDHAFHGVIPVV